MADAIRYQPLRALPPHPYVPGRESGDAQGAATRPREAPAPPALYLPDKRWEKHDEYLWGVDLYNAGFFWEAHEAWEALWRAAQRDPVQHAFLQGLIQYAAACLKGAMGDAEAARRLAARAAARFDHVRTVRGDQYMGLDVAQFAAAFRRFSDAEPTAIERRPQLSLPALDADALPAVALPIDGVLDLHAFRPPEVSALVQDYLDECQKRGILEARVIHGKGTGALRRTVHAVLERREDVLEYRLAPDEHGGWGATLVTLKPSG